MSGYRMPAVFHLGETLDCGQAFRWEEQGGVWKGIVRGKALSIEERDDQLLFDCSEEEFQSFWQDYFDLQTDYEAVKAELSAMSTILKDAAAFAPGIRILRQDPWEALCSFIISQNNNIPRIKGIIARFCALLGKDTGVGFDFPTPERVALCTPEDLAPIRSGFRAKYLISAARLVTEGAVSLPSLYTLPLPEARVELMRIQGVGPKVAECVLLYGFHRTECFPMDVWMKRAMNTLFPENKPEDFGIHAGIAQQYIFHYSRMNPALFQEEDNKQKGTV